MFRSYTNKFKYSLKVKHDISELVDIFTSDMENTRFESRMWFHMNFEWLIFQYNTRIYV